MKVILTVVIDDVTLYYSMFGKNQHISFSYSQKLKQHVFEETLFNQPDEPQIK